MLHGHIVIVHGGGLVLGGGEALVQGGGEVQLLRPAGHAGELAQLLVHSGVEALHHHAHLLQKLGHQPALLVQKGAEQMQLLDLGIAPGPGDGLAELNGLDGFLGIGIEVHKHTPFNRNRLLALSSLEC